MLKNRGLAFKLCFFILLLSGAIFTVLFLYNYYSVKKLFIEKAEEDAKTVALSAASRIDKVFTASGKIARVIATLLENTTYSKIEIKEFLEAMVDNHPEIYGSCIAYQPGMFNKKIKKFAPYACRSKDKVTYMDIAGNYDYFFSDWYQIPKELKRPYWSEPYYDEGGGNIIMTTYSVPFYKKVNGKSVFAGITTVDISLAWLRKFLSKIKIYENGYVFIISAKGTMISHPNKSIIMNESIFSIAEETGNKSLRELGRKMIKGERGFTVYDSMTMNKSGLIYYTPLDNNWSIGVFYPKGEILAGLREQSFNIAVCEIIGIVFLLLVIIIVSHRITVPLRKLTTAVMQIGTGDLDATIPVSPGNDEISRLGKAFVVMQEELKNYIKNLKETTVAKERIESELRIAHKIQMSMVPRLFPAFPESDEFDIFASMIPAKSVGGDLYDFFFLDEKRFCFVVGDVAGKGIPAALFMAVCRTMLRGKARKNMSSNEIVIAINSELSEDNDMAMFITLYVCILDIETGELDCCNAGHNPPYILKASGGFKVLNNVHGAPVGLFAGEEYKSDKIKLNLGDRIVLYTDGVTEAFNNSGSLYSDQRLNNVLKTVSDDLSAKEIVELVTEDVKHFVGDAEASDDITVEVLTYNGNDNQPEKV